MAGFTAPSVDGKTWPSPDLSNCRCSQPEASSCPRRAPGGPMQFFFFPPTLNLTAGCQQPCKNSIFTLLCILLPPPTLKKEQNTAGSRAPHSPGQKRLESIQSGADCALESRCGTTVTEQCSEERNVTGRWELDARPPHNGSMSTEAAQWTDTDFCE